MSRIGTSYYFILNLFLIPFSCRIPPGEPPGPQPPTDPPIPPIPEPTDPPIVRPAWRVYRPRKKKERTKSSCIRDICSTTTYWYSDDLSPTSLFVFYLHSLIVACIWYSNDPKPLVFPLYMLVFYIFYHSHIWQLSLDFRTYLRPPIMASCCLYLIQQRPTPQLNFDRATSSSTSGRLLLFLTNLTIRKSTCPVP